MFNFHKRDYYICMKARNVSQQASLQKPLEKLSNRLMHIYPLAFVWSCIILFHLHRLYTRVHIHLGLAEKLKK